MDSIVDETNLMKAVDNIAFDDDEKFKDVVIENESVSEKETNRVLSDELSNETLSKEQTDKIMDKKSHTFVFVLGGPGGGKSTQCAKLAKEIGYTHLSSGDLLRKAAKTDPVNGPMIESMLKEGLSVPPDLTIFYVQKAIDESENDKFLLDGLPRDEEIHSEFRTTVNTEPKLVLFFDCSQEERERRILRRNQGRVDDNPDTVRKRFTYFEEHTIPIIEYYRSKGIVTKIDAAKPMEEVYETLKSYLSPKCAVEAKAVESVAQLEVDISKINV